MKGDIVLKVIVGLLIPIFILYSCFFVAKFNELGIFVFFNSIIYVAFAYLLFLIRFEKSNTNYFKIFNYIIASSLIVFLYFILDFLGVFLNLKMW